VWADGKDAALVDGVANYVVSGGSITLAHSVSNAVVGLFYEARFGSAKLAYAAQQGAAVNQIKKVDHIGFTLLDTHAQGLRFGPDLAHLDALPQIEDGALVDPHYVWPSYDKVEIEFDGDSDSDPRFWLVAASPRPANVLGATVNLVTQG
jgi:hypothetical protein